MSMWAFKGRQKKSQGPTEYGMLRSAALHEPHNCLQLCGRLCTCHEALDSMQVILWYEIYNSHESLQTNKVFSCKDTFPLDLQAYQLESETKPLWLSPPPPFHLMIIHGIWDESPRAFDHTSGLQTILPAKIGCGRPRKKYSNCLWESYSFCCNYVCSCCQGQQGQVFLVRKGF